jgi:urea transporter
VLPYFSNPLLLMQMRPQIEASLAQTPDGPRMLNTIFGAVRHSLEHGITEIFFWSAVIMSIAVLVHLLLRSEPLRTHAHVPEPDIPM